MSVEKQMSEGWAQLAEYEPPRLVSLTRVRLSRGQNPTCSSGQQATMDCLSGYNAHAACNPTGLAAGGGCTTGDGVTITSRATNGQNYSI